MDQGIQAQAFNLFINSLKKKKTTKSYTSFSDMCDPHFLLYEGLCQRPSASSTHL